MNKLFYVFAFLTLNLSAVELADVSVAEEPLMKKLSFQTAQMSVRPLVLSDYDAARAVDASDSSFVDIIKADTRALLSTQKRILDGSTEINTLRQNQELSNIYYGAFLKNSDTLVGLIDIHGFHDNPHSKCYLRTDGKYHKAHQGKGYASEVKKALFQHFQTLKIIPTAEVKKTRSGEMKDISPAEIKTESDASTEVEITPTNEMENSFFKCGCSFITSMGTAFWENYQYFGVVTVSEKEDTETSLAQDIPASQVEDVLATKEEDTPFLGFKGLINLRNKASLKYNIINCGYKVGRLFGDRVEVYFPFVVERLPYLKDVFITWIDEAGVSSVRTEDSFNSSELLHDSIADFLAQYLSRDAATSVIGEKALRLESLRSLVTAGDDALREENVFVINTLSKSLELLDGDLLTGKLDLIAELYTQSNRELRWMRAFYYFYSPANRRKINDNINNLRIVSSHLGIRNNSWCCFS